MTTLTPAKPATNLKRRRIGPARLTVFRSPSLRQRLHPATFSLGTIVLVALGVRFLVAAFNFSSIAIPDRNFGDFGGEMGWVARSIALGHGFSSPFYPQTGPTAMLPPFFPYLLAGVFKVFGLYTRSSALTILLLDSVFSSLTCIPLYLSVRQTVDSRMARYTAWAWALYPFAIYYSAAWVWDYALTSLLFAWAFYAAQRIHLAGRWYSWLGFGLLYGVCALSNPSVLAALPFLLALSLWKVRRVSGPWLQRGAVALLGIVLAVTPWTIRNQRAMHTFVPMRDGFWLEFYAGNHGDTSASNPNASHPATNPAEMVKYQAMGEIAYANSQKAMAKDWVAHHPVAFAVVTLRRVVRFWTGFWSVTPTYLASQPFELPGIGFCTAVTVLMLIGMVRWAREDFEHFLPYGILLLTFPVTYYLTHASMDYRQPIEPQVIVLVSVAMFGFRRARVTSIDRELEEAAA